jgi:hypothetical protein
MARKTIEKYETGLRGKYWYIEGYVTDVWRDDSTIGVAVRGVVGSQNPTQMVWQELYFPPNDPRDLAELVRAQTHPHLRVYAWGIVPKNEKLPIRVDGCR